MAALTAEELRELRRLHVQLGRRVDSLLSGDYRSAVRGQGMEFEEVRAYVPGDDVRHIDWNVTARSGSPYVKVYKEERQLTLVLAVDVSGSTRAGGGGQVDRRLQIARIAGGLAWAGFQNQDRVGLLLFSDQVETWLPPGRSRGQLWAILRSIYEAQGRRPGTDLEGALSFLARTQKRRAVLVLVSDFLDDKPWQRALGSLTRRHDVHAVLVHDPLDVGELGGLGLMELVDAETGEVLLVDGHEAGDTRGAAVRLEALTRMGARTLAVGPDDDPFRMLQRHFQGAGWRR